MSIRASLVTFGTPRSRSRTRRQGGQLGATIETLEVRLVLSSAPIAYDIEPIESHAELLGAELMDNGSQFQDSFSIDGSSTAGVHVARRPWSFQPPPDGAGNRPLAARDIGQLGQAQTFTDYVGRGDRRDYYRFQLSSFSAVELTLSGLEGNADLYLMDSGGRQVMAKSRNASVADESISKILEAGTYHVLVKRSRGASTNYTATFSATALDVPQDNAGNTISAARDLGILNGEQTSSDFVGMSDRNDFYKFRLEQSSDVQITLDGLGDNAQLYLKQSGQRGWFARSTSPGDAAEEISEALDTGTYFILVRSTRFAATNYDLTVSATADTPPAPPDGAGNSLAEARDMGTLNSSSSFTDWVGLADNHDYYRFSLDVLSDVDLTLTGLSADIDLYLNNSSGTEITRSWNAGTASEAIRETLNPGVYYVLVTPWATAESDYQLSLAGSERLPEPPPANEFNSSYGYGLVDAAAAVSAAIGDADGFEDVPVFGGSLDWNLNMINAPEVWAQGYSGQGVVVAVVDTGVDYTHPDLDANIWQNVDEVAGNGIDDDANGFVDDRYGWDFAGNDNDPRDQNSHGTHVAGTIAGENNGFGVTGVAYNAMIMPVQVLSASGSGWTSDVAMGIQYAVDNGAQVVNLSLGGGFSAMIKNAVRYAFDREVVVVMAAGNAGNSQPGYPANHAVDWGIAVGAVNSSNRMPNFSNRAGNTELDYVIAPGVSIYSSTPGNNYARFSGTSMATPHVAGVAALIRSANPGLTAAQIERLIADTANANGITGNGVTTSGSGGSGSSSLLVSPTFPELVPQLIGRRFRADMFFFDASTLTAELQTRFSSIELHNARNLALSITSGPSDHSTRTTQELHRDVLLLSDSLHDAWPAADGRPAAEIASHDFAVAFTLRLSALDSAFASLPLAGLE